MVNALLKFINLIITFNGGTNINLMLFSYFTTCMYLRTPHQHAQALISYMHACVKVVIHVATYIIIIIVYPHSSYIFLATGQVNN